MKETTSTSLECGCLLDRSVSPLSQMNDTCTSEGSYQIDARIDVILEARSERLEATLTACYDLLERYESSSYSDGYLCCGQDENCDALNFGSMIKELKRCGLWPRPAKSSGITGSVRDIIERLTLAPSPVLPSSQEFSHEGCTFGKALEEDLNFIRERKEPSGVVDSQRIHMAAQCKAVW